MMRLRHIPVDNQAGTNGSQHVNRYAGDSGLSSSPATALQAEEGKVKPAIGGTIVTSLEEEIDAEELLALSEQIDADRLTAFATDLAARSRKRLLAVALARAALYGDQPPVALRDEHGCRESFIEWC
jgi:hypothetical protein